MFWDRENEKQFKQIERQVSENQMLYKKVFGSPEGEKVLEDLKKRCFVSRTTYNDNHGQMSFNEGRRSIFAYINNLLSKDLKEVLESITKTEE